MIQDIRYAVRILLKNKLFTTIAVFSLALGIGANTAIFSLIDAVMLKMLPVKEPQRLALSTRDSATETNHLKESLPQAVWGGRDWLLTSRERRWNRPSLTVSRAIFSQFWG
jgi:hypothetical protein